MLDRNNALDSLLGVFTYMKLRHFILLLFVLLTRTSFATPFDISSIRKAQHKADDYIRAAVSLQAMGKEAACQALLDSAKTASRFDDRYIVLCRILFMQRGTNEFRPPFTMCSYLVGEAADWRLGPIELVDGVPFFLTGFCGGDGGRLPDSGEAYLRYCMANCDWNTYTFHEVTAKQKGEALTKLFLSAQAKRPLNDFQKAFLSAQIE
jgi:hypothetical protein